MLCIPTFEKSVLSKRDGVGSLKITSEKPLRNFSDQNSPFILTPSTGKGR